MVSGGDGAGANDGRGFETTVRDWDPKPLQENQTRGDSLDDDCNTMHERGV